MQDAWLLYLLLILGLFVGVILAVHFRLLEARLALARMIGYGLALAIAVTIYCWVALILTHQFTQTSGLDDTELFLLLLPALLLALTFHGIEKFISKYIQQALHDDVYDTREVLDKLSASLLTADNEIDSIMRRSLAVLQRTLQASHAYLAVLNSSGVIYHHLSVGRETPAEVEAFIKHLPKLSGGLVTQTDKPDDSLSKLLAADSSEVLLRLGTAENNSGFLLLGPKQNGARYTKQDLALLQTAAKDMAIALDNAKKYEQILHFADTLHRTIKEETSSLRRANEKLKNLDAMKDDFIATASHQLRTPASSVHDALRMLNHPSLTKKDREELIDLAEASSEHLVNVVRTMLNMARLQAGHFTIDKSNAELVGLTEKAIEQVKILAEQKKTKIKLIKPNHPIMTRVDAAKVNEALSNYIENAIKYSPQRSTVTVSLLESGGKAIFEVADQGMGVPATEQKNLFQKFYRATNARQEEPDGNGIGLYVVKNIAEGHGGKAYYRSIEGKGSLFGFTVAMEGLPADK